MPRAYAKGDVLLGKYVLESPLGEGGMGTVWLARNITLDAPVALKLIRPELDLDEASDRLLKEARATAKIEHRAIVRVFDFGVTEGGDPFIVMELLDGSSLADLLEERGKLPAEEVVQILLPVIDGLSRAHAEGIVHRDLKPSNIFLARETKRIQPKVVDFGIAKLDGQDPMPKLTRQGTVLGSPAYMAPEQARGLDDVDHRADVWTVCVVLYEAVTGANAFQGANYNAVLRAVIEDEVAPMDQHGVDDPELSRIVARGLEKRRDDRFPTMRALGEALARWLVSRGVTEDVSGQSVEEEWLAEPFDFDGLRSGLEEEPAGGAVSCRESEILPLVSRKRMDLPGESSGTPEIPESQEESAAPVVCAPSAPTRSRLAVGIAISLAAASFSAAFVAARQVQLSDAAPRPRAPSVRTTTAPAPSRPARVELRSLPEPAATGRQPAPLASARTDENRAALRPTAGGEAPHRAPSKLPPATGAPAATATSTQRDPSKQPAFAVPAAREPLRPSTRALDLKDPY